MNNWLRIPKQAADYCGVSVRTFEDWLKSGLKYCKVGGCRLTKPEFIDDFLLQHEVNHNEVDEIVNEVMAGL